MLKKLYNAVEHEISFIRDSLEDIESKIFKGQEKEMVESLSHSGRDLLNLRQSIEPHRDILKDMQTDAISFFGEEFAPYLRALINKYHRVHNHIMRNTESMHELRETNNSLLSTKQNEVMKILTLMAFVTFPLSLVASIFGMNTTYLPIIGHPNDFWIIIAIMGVGMLLMFAYFKRKGWL